eukprot:363017-Chlamydomonas_euryale.AAC.4
MLSRAVPTGLPPAAGRILTASHFAWTPDMGDRSSGQRPCLASALRVSHCLAADVQADPFIAPANTSPGDAVCCIAGCHSITMRRYQRPHGKLLRADACLHHMHAHRVTTTSSAASVSVALMWWPCALRPQRLNVLQGPSKQ